MLSPKLAAMAVLVTLLQFALAVACEGGVAEFFSHPPLTAMAIISAGLVGAALFTKCNLSSGETEDRGNRWVLFAFSLLALATAIVPAYSDRHDLLTFGGDTIRWIGIGIFTIGGILRLWPVFVLGNRFSGLVAIQREHRLVTTGVYSIIRHPSYLGLFTGVLGWALAFRSGIGVILALLFLVPLLARINAEETLLHTKFGAEYDAYRRRTWRLLPGLF